jgi:Tol biopolymer transport system component
MQPLEVRSSVKLSGPLTPGGSVYDFAIASDAARVVYTADQDTYNVGELYSVPIDGSSAPTKLNGSLPVGGSVQYFVISPDGSTVVYMASQDTRTKRELYSVPIDGSSAPIKLNGPLPLGGNVNGVIILPDGTRVIYLADQETNEVVEVYSVPIDGSSAPIKLNGTLTSGGNVTGNWRWSPDSSRLIYNADQDVDEVYELFSVPVDGSSAEVKLNLSGDFTWIFGYAVTADSSTVIYLLPDPLEELYAVPIGGPASSSVKLNGSLPAGGFVRGFTFGPDSTRVVYAADQDTYEVIELYSVPIDASASAVRLHGPLPPDADVELPFNISPDGTLVVYRADPNIDEVDELFCAPADASGAPIKLHEVTVPGDRVGYFQGSGMPIWARRAVYPLWTGGLPDLCSVKIDGSQPPVVLNDPVTDGGSLSSAALPFRNPDATIFAYAGEVESVGTVEAYIAPIYGNLPPVKINDSLVYLGNVGDYGLSGDEAYAVYMADQDTLQVVELYSKVLDTDADGVPNLTDNCPRAVNPGQNAVVFGQQIVAASGTEFSWSITQDVDYVRGPLGQVNVYAIDTSGSLLDAVSFSDPSVPAAGSGWYYLFALGRDCAARSWQTTLGAEALRDATLP